MKKVLVFGTFDLLHDGHRSFLNQAKAHGDTLVVAIARDQNVKRFKGRFPVQDELLRLKQIMALPNVDDAVLGRLDHEYMKLLDEIKPDIVCLGYDQEPFDLHKRLQGSKIKIIRLKPYREGEFKTSILRRYLGI